LWKAKLKGATLEGANLSEASLLGVDLRWVTMPDGVIYD